MEIRSSEHVGEWHMAMTGMARCGHLRRLRTLLSPLLRSVLSSARLRLVYGVPCCYGGMHSWQTGSIGMWVGAVMTVSLVATVTALVSDGAGERRRSDGGGDCCERRGLRPMALVGAVAGEGA